MSGDAIETMAKALYAHENTADNWEWDDETEGFLDDYRQLAAVALSVVRDELADEALREAGVMDCADEQELADRIADERGRYPEIRGDYSEAADEAVYEVIAPDIARVVVEAGWVPRSAALTAVAARFGGAS